MAKFYALDLETKPLGDNVPEKNAYALEPWSFGIRSTISSVSVCDGSKTVTITDLTKIPRVLSDLKGKQVWGANVLFDVAYLLAAFGREAVMDIEWLDVQLMAKFLKNGDAYRDEHFPLTQCASMWAKDWEHLEDFLTMKATEHKPGFDADYWLARGDMDATVTHIIASQQIKELPREQRNMFIWVCRSIVPLAESLVQGILVDYSVVDKMEVELKQQSDALLQELGLSAKVIASSKQLGDVLFNQWGMPIISRSEKTNEPSTSADDLKRMHYQTKDPRMATLLKYKTLATIQSKYVKGFRSAREYLGRDSIHGFPRVLATATGRMSFSSNLKKKHQTSIALHQLPSRKKEGKMVKKCLVAPPGYGFVCFDVSAQELKFMAQVSRDPVMIDAFNKKLDLHSLLASEIFGVPYDDLVLANKNGEPHHLIKYRQAGKRVNLSSQYRISHPALSEKFFTLDDEVIDEYACESYLYQYKRTYKGIPAYWKSVIAKTKRNKFTETLGGYRYYTLASNWQQASSAINHPVQGSAAMMSYFDIAKIFREFPDFVLQLQVHDSLLYLVQIDNEEQLRQRASDLEHYLNDVIDYTEIFKEELLVKFTCDVSYGYNYGELKHV